MPAKQAPLVVIRGGGDLASGVAHRLWSAGFRAVILEIPQPTVIRRAVAFAEAVYEGRAAVEGVTALLAGSVDEALRTLAQEMLPVLVDPEGRSIAKLAPMALVDAILAKRNLGTRLDQAPLVIGLGPGFTAGLDVHAVVETRRGHNLGKVIWDGQAEPDTGIPEPVGGFAAERVVRAPQEGIFRPVAAIGDRVAAGEPVAYVESAGKVEVQAKISGVLRGILREGLRVTAGMKVGDIDPRGERSYCFSISDKARAIGGGVLEAIMAAQHGLKGVNANGNKGRAPFTGEDQRPGRAGYHSP